MSFEIENYHQIIKHGKGFNKKLNKQVEGESSNCFAYQIDNGFSEELGFANGSLSQADYFLFDEHTKTNITIIELTRVSEIIQEAYIIYKQLEKQIKTIREQMIDDGNKSKETLEKKLNKTIQVYSSQKIWGEVVGEFKNKWMGSIAILERYCRRIEQAEDFKYHKFLVVFSNDIESRLLESIEEKLRPLQGMGMEVKVCCTKHVDTILKQ